MSPDPRNPAPTVDVVIELCGPARSVQVVLIQRLNPPHGWALPGGFVDYGESVETAARREALEETGLMVELVALLGVYSDPRRDPRQHTQTTVFAARAQGEPRAGDDAKGCACFSLERLPQPLCFDHDLILRHYAQWCRGMRSRRAGANDQEVAMDRERTLTLEEQKELLGIARRAVEQSAKGRALPAESSDFEGLEFERGAFVTLHKAGRLRGCIGNFSAEGPLLNTVQTMALAAARQDPRFPPVSPSEVPDLELEISVLSPLKKIEDVGEIQVGVHGIYIINPRGRGVLLPQVATEYGWDRDTFLDQTCVKAGLNPGCWQDPRTEILIFSAQIFSEKDLMIRE